MFAGSLEASSRRSVRTAARSVSIPRSCSLSVASSLRPWLSRCLKRASASRMAPAGRRRVAAASRAPPLLEPGLGLADVAGEPLLRLHQDEDLLLHAGLLLLDLLDLDQDRGGPLVGLDLVEAGLVLGALGLDDLEILLFGALVLAGGV